MTKRVKPRNFIGCMCHVPYFRWQVLVLRCSKQEQIVDSIVRMSPLWVSIKRLRLTTNMRVVNDLWFSEFFYYNSVMKIRKETVNNRFICLPNGMTWSFNTPIKLNNPLDSLTDVFFFLFNTIDLIQNYYFKGDIII